MTQVVKCLLLIPKPWVQFRVTLYHIVMNEVAVEQVSLRVPSAFPC
jgi:hypothetical protein